MLQKIMGVARSALVRFQFVPEATGSLPISVPAGSQLVQQHNDTQVRVNADALTVTVANYFDVPIELRTWGANGSLTTVTLATIQPAETRVLQVFKTAGNSNNYLAFWFGIGQAATKGEIMFNITAPPLYLSKLRAWWGGSRGVKSHCGFAGGGQGDSNGSHVKRVGLVATRLITTSAARFDNIRNYARWNVGSHDCGKAHGGDSSTSTRRDHENNNANRAGFPLRYRNKRRGHGSSIRSWEQRSGRKIKREHGENRLTAKVVAHA